MHLTPETRIYVAGHRGLVGSAVVRNLRARGYNNLILRTHHELDLTEQAAVRDFFEVERPAAVVMAAARVGGIQANNTRPAEFIRDNLLIQDNVIDAAYRAKCEKFVFLGSSCIYPKMAPQPIKEDYLLTGSFGAHQRVVCDREDRRPENLPGLPSTVRIQCDLVDADELVRPRR